jgi:hypothetical protein
MVVLAFIKILFFMRIFEDYGFLVQMVLLTLVELIPFFGLFVIATIFFAMCLFVIQVDIDSELAAVDAPRIIVLLIQVYRVAIGEPGVPKHASLITDGTFYSTANILLIWGVWFCNTFFMIIIMLNFLIAVISQTYEEVIN